MVFLDIVSQDLDMLFQEYHRDQSFDPFWLLHLLITFLLIVQMTQFHMTQQHIINSYGPDFENLVSELNMTMKKALVWFPTCSLKVNYSKTENMNFT